MKVAVVGSRDLIISNLEKYVPYDALEIVSGGAKGVDTCAREYAIKNKLRLKEFLPDYTRYGRKAPLLRNLEIIDYSDIVIAFWDKKSRGTKFTIDNCRKRNKPCVVYYVNQGSVL